MSECVSVCVCVCMYLPSQEQYALVYRAVRFLFEHHLEALDVPCSPEQEEVSCSGVECALSLSLSLFLSICLVE